MCYQIFISMKKKKPLSIRTIYWITQIIFWMIAVIGAATVVFNVLVYTPFFGDDLQLHAQLPVKVNFLEKGILSKGNCEHQVELVESTGKIHFINTPMFIARPYGTVMLIAILFIFYLFFTFRKFIINVYKDKIFEYSNVELLRQLAYGLLAFWIFAIIYSRLAYRFIKHRLEFQQIEIMEDYRNFAGILLLALFTWVLSHIFSRGVKLKEEQELTI